MDRKSFGRLVKALRYQYQKEARPRLTQKQLEQKLDLPTRTIERLERGELVNLNIKLLIELAGFFGLTTAERREFVFGAMGGDEKRNEYGRRKVIDADVEKTLGQISRKDSGEYLDNLLNVLDNLVLPAFIADSYGDIIAVNTSMIKIHLTSDGYITGNTRVNAKYNVLRVFFDPSSGCRQLLGDSWENHVIRVMQFFRGISLRYRMDPYFQSTLDALSKYDKFWYYWSSTYNEHNDVSSGPNRYRYRHQLLGSLDYFSTVSPSITPYGELFTTIYVPLSIETGTKFDELKSSSGFGTLRLAQWPEKGV